MQAIMCKSTAWYGEKEIVVVFSVCQDIDNARKYIEESAVEQLKKQDGKFFNARGEVKIAITHIADDESKFYEGVYKWDGEKLTVTGVGVSCDWKTA